MSSSSYQGYATFKAAITSDGILTVTFSNPPVNMQDLAMIADLHVLCNTLEKDPSIKVVVFQSDHPEIWVAHADPYFLKDMSTKAVPLEQVELLDLQSVLERVSKLPQATIAKIEGFARGGGHEMALACDMRFAVRGKAKFMQMEVAMGILPCGGGASRMARHTGLGRALELCLMAQDFDADLAERYGTVNRALEADEIGPYVDTLARRIALWPSASINATKKAVYESIDYPIAEALKHEAYWLYQATSVTPAIKRFRLTDEKKATDDMEIQRNWNDLCVNTQAIQNDE